MSDPYEVLELTPDAGETEIRQRYLELVRAFPPTGHRSGSPRSTRPTQRFATRPTGCMHRFSRSQPKSDSFESIAADLHARLRDVRLPVDTLLSWADSP